MQKQFIAANNKKAYYDYFIEDVHEAGMVLTGTEIKSIRKGACSLKEAYIRMEKDGVYVHGMHISPYEQGNIFNTDPLRPKKLLLHKTEIQKLREAAAKKGYTVVPLKVYLSGKYAKMEIALARGKKNYDKRECIAKKDEKRQMERFLKQF